MNLGELQNKNRRLSSKRRHPFQLLSCGGDSELKTALWAPSPVCPPVRSYRVSFLDSERDPKIRGQKKSTTYLSPKRIYSGKRKDCNSEPRDSVSHKYDPSGRQMEKVLCKGAQDVKRRADPSIELPVGLSRHRMCVRLIQALSMPV